MWVDNESLALAVDELSYTHTSSGYEEAQSAVEDFLTMDIEQLMVYYHTISEHDELKALRNPQKTEGH